MLLSWKRPDWISCLTLGPSGTSWPKLQGNLWAVCFWSQFGFCELKTLWCREVKWMKQPKNPVSYSCFTDWKVCRINEHHTVFTYKETNGWPGQREHNVRKSLNKWNNSCPHTFGHVVWFVVKNMQTFFVSSYGCKTPSRTSMSFKSQVPTVTRLIQVSTYFWPSVTVCSCQ